MKRVLLTFSAMTLAMFWSISAHAAIIGVSQGFGSSTLGGNAAKINAPANVLDNNVTNIACRGSMKLKMCLRARLMLLIQGQELLALTSLSTVT